LSKLRIPNYDRTTSCHMRTAGRQDDEAIELAFSKRKIEERKAWLAGFEPGTYLDQSVDQISYSDFVNKVCNRASEILSMQYHPPATLCKYLHSSAHAHGRGIGQSVREIFCPDCHYTCAHTCQPLRLSAVTCVESLKACSGKQRSILLCILHARTLASLKGHQR